MFLEEGMDRMLFADEQGSEMKDNAIQEDDSDDENLPRLVYKGRGPMNNPKSYCTIKERN